MTALEVISAARRRLGDARRERWTDDQLLLYVSLCQNDICIFTNFHRKSHKMAVYTNHYVYNLPTDCVRVERLEYNCQFFPIESRNTIDSGKAEYPCALKDNLQYGQVEIRVKEGCDTFMEVLEDKYGVVTSIEDQLLGDEFGVVSSIIDEFNPPPTGEDLIGYITVYYSAVPDLIEEPLTKLVLPDMWLAAFMHYVCGTALQDDNDANNIQRGDLELQKYARMLDQMFKASAKDFTTNYKSKLTTEIRRV